MPVALSGSIRALIQANNSRVLAGSSDAGKIFYSTDDGVTWELAQTLGSSTDTVHAFAKVPSSGTLYAAVTGSVGAEGIWRSTDHGSTWTRIRTHPDGSGYTDVVWVNATGHLVAVGPKVASSSNSNIAILTPSGTWVSPSFTFYYYDLLAAAYPDYPYLHTLYPGETSTAPDAFTGTNTYYTVGARIFANTGSASALVSGAMGNGGLDMVAYSFFSATASGYYRRALWAVKSAADLSNTEIWQWPDPTVGFPTANRFAKIATITGKVFNVLYVDPTPSYTASQRTIWAGADGEILVSYNDGLTWTVATTAPANQIRSFLRTSSGVLMAGGDSGELFIYLGTQPGDPGSGEEEDPEQPETPPGFVPSTKTLGRSATSENFVPVANKTGYYNVSHVVRYDASGAAYTNLQFADDPPYQLLPDVPAAGDTVFFGSRTNDTNVPGGTFSSLVFNISQVCEECIVNWQYWDGLGWENLEVRDNTSGFKVLGENTVSWIPPDDWDTTTVNSVTGYWVKAVVASVTGTAQPPVQALRYIYTQLLPYVTIAESEVSGGFPALAKILWNNLADGLSEADPALDVDRLIVGLRSTSRGTNFNAYLNLTDQELPFGVEVESQTASGSFVDALGVATDRAFQVSYATAGPLAAWNSLIEIALSTSVAQEYYGTYRAFLRCKVTGGSSTTWKVRLAVAFGSGGGYTYTKEYFVTPVSVDYVCLDMGRISIPTSALAGIGGNVGDRLSITVQGYATAQNIPLTLYDLVLMPVEEWIGDFQLPNALDPTISNSIEGENYLEIDSVGNPKTLVAAYNRTEGGLIKGMYQPIANGPTILQKNARQRLWFLAMSYRSASRTWNSHPNILGGVMVRKVQRYLSLRGEN